MCGFCHEWKYAKQKYCITFVQRRKNIQENLEFGKFGLGKSLGLGKIGFKKEVLVMVLE